MKNVLPKLREQIDAIDNSIIDLLAKRQTIVQEIGKWKKVNNVPALDDKRWREVLTSKKQLAKSHGLSETLVEEIYNLIHKHSLGLEEQV